MVDTSKMTSEEKSAYIFTKDKRDGIEPFRWLDLYLIGDMATFLDGINLYHKLPEEYLKIGVEKGGGNLSLPILICTTLELASSFYCGSENGNARENVKQFVTKYFPGFYARIPTIFWTGVRNGLTHRFYPNNFKYEEKGVEKEVTFHFYVEDANQPSHIKKNQNHVSIYLNVPELYKLLKDAIAKYRAELTTNENLKDNFIHVYDFLRDTQNIRDQERIRECSLLFERLTTRSELVLKNDKDSNLVPKRASGAEGSAGFDRGVVGPSGSTNPK